ncbi:MAG: hypothetical protein AAGG81_05775 [Chlamydiota bacterium]
MDSTNRDINKNSETLAGFMENAVEDINKVYLDNTEKNQSFDDDFESC